MPTYQYERVADAIRAKIRDGTYPAGTQLPTRPMLRQEYGVSDMVINEAMRILRRDGLVEPLHGVGVFVRATPP